MVCVTDRRCVNDTAPPGPHRGASSLCSNWAPTGTLWVFSRVCYRFVSGLSLKDKVQSESAQFFIVSSLLRSLVVFFRAMTTLECPLSAHRAEGFGCVSVMVIMYCVSYSATVVFSSKFYSSSLVTSS